MTPECRGFSQQQSFIVLSHGLEVDRQGNPRTGPSACASSSSSSSQHGPSERQHDPSCHSSDSNFSPGPLGDLQAPKPSTQATRRGRMWRGRVWPWSQVTWPSPDPTITHSETLYEGLDFHVPQFPQQWNEADRPHCRGLPGWLSNSRPTTVLSLLNSCPCAHSSSFKDGSWGNFPGTPGGVSPYSSSWPSSPQVSGQLSGAAMGRVSPTQRLSSSLPQNFPPMPLRPPQPPGHSPELNWQAFIPESWRVVFTQKTVQNAYSSFLHNHPKLAATKMSSNRWMGKQTVVHPRHTECSSGIKTSKLLFMHPHGPT